MATNVRISIYALFPWYGAYPSMLTAPFYEGEKGRTGDLEHAASHFAANAGCPKQGAIPAWVRNAHSTQGRPVLWDHRSGGGGRVKKGVYKHLNLTHLEAARREQWAYETLLERALSAEVDGREQKEQGGKRLSRAA
jgi:hypothetical protein